MMGNSFLDPAGPIAAAQRGHMIEVILWTMIAIVPVFVLVPILYWRYRYRNQKSTYKPQWESSLFLDVLMWGVPFVIIGILSVLLWKNTHALDPYKPIASTEVPLNVEVVGLDWKWLFIYPDYGIATVNELVIPVGASVSLNITTDTVMQSFMVPALAGQIYAMPGMRTKLNILADKEGRFLGENTQFNGSGFTEQKFETIAMTQQDFSNWIAKVKRVGVPLDTMTYNRVAIGSTGSDVHSVFGTKEMPQNVVYFNTVEANLFASIMHRYMKGTPVPPKLQPGAVEYVPPIAPPSDLHSTPHSTPHNMAPTKGIKQ
ncbi:MAG: ubiquinol oxidase subunit II [Glaciecola sp.]|jgi:cytochrome o ubiquinol oxidase subunit 2